MNLYDSMLEMRADMEQVKVTFANKLVYALNEVNHDPLVKYLKPGSLFLANIYGIKIAQYNDNPDLNLYVVVDDSSFVLTTGKYNNTAYWASDIHGRPAYYATKGVTYEIRESFIPRKGRQCTFNCSSSNDTLNYINVCKVVSNMFKSLNKSYKMYKKREAQSRKSAQEQVTRYNTQFNYDNGLNKNT